ncbi:MAG: type II toxin-antitoxin system VapC family toxin [Puniceicoccaceae bacterium]
MDFLADIDFVDSVWKESLEGITGEARRFAEANSRSSFAVSVPTSIRLLASAGADDPEIVERFLKAFPVIPFDESLIARCAAFLRAHDLPLETAIEGAIAKCHDLKILTATPSRYDNLPGIAVVDFRASEDI